MTNDSIAGPEEVDQTIDLLSRVRAGDAEALNTLFARHVPLLRRWASGRLPHWARDIADTVDLVQDTVLETLKHLDTFEPRGDGALQAYLRHALINHVRNELRRASTHPQGVALESRVPSDRTSPLEAAMGRQLTERYEAGLAALSPEERDAVIARVEFGMSYGEVAEVVDKPSPAAARMTVTRALVKLAREMKRLA